MQSIKIAIADDEIPIRSLLEQTLEDLEGEPEIIMADNGAEGLAREIPGR
ncbi:MAG: hypothetical protein PHQ05_07230 [Sterolibacterium sp.]|nr:hypothetical protein [Sterolibacterium sp.]